tara:strand:+ start:15311 stop:15982 length:672 start_codon:yes stop_codon:yes gene_type:complete
MIDWNNKPEGAQRHNENLEHKWLKLDDGNVSYYTSSGWKCYINPKIAREYWNAAATTDPRATPTPMPLQLSWDDAKPDATHILEHRATSNQWFAIKRTDGAFVGLNEPHAFYKLDDWFVVSERPVDNVTVVKEVYYIAGPMAGHVALNRPAFNAESHRLILNGHTVLNPATLPDGLTQAQYMDICLAMLRCATRIRMLDGWEKSEGARIEHALAVKSLIKVEY